MNGFEEVQRARKVRNIVALIWSGVTPENRRNHQLPWTTSQLDAKWWEDVAWSAGRHRPPSDETRRQVVESLAQLVNAERRGLPEPCPECDEGVVYVQACGCDETPEGCRHPETMLPCDACGGDGLVLCEACGTRMALVVTPAGFACVPCSRRDFPGLADAVARTVELAQEEPQRLKAV